MDDKEAHLMLSALANLSRVKTLRALAVAGKDGLPSGAIAGLVGLPRNLMSSHLAIMQKAGLIEGRKEGRSIIYSAVPGTLDRLGDHVHALSLPIATCSYR